MYPGMDAIDLDSSGSSQDHNVRTFPVGDPESPFVDVSPRPGLPVGSLEV